MYTGSEVFRTDISHFVKNVNEVKLYVAYMRILHLLKYPQFCCILHSIPILHMPGMI